jgi:hypothetical protein
MLKRSNCLDTETRGKHAENTDLKLKDLAFSVSNFFPTRKRCVAAVVAGNDSVVQTVG